MIIQEVISAAVGLMTANGDSFSFAHSEQEWQNIHADNAALPVVYLDMPIKFRPVILKSGAIENEYICVITILYKDRIGSSPEDKYEILKKAHIAQRQLQLILNNNKDDIKQLTVGECYELLNLLDADLSGVAMPLQIKIRDINQSVCVPS